MSEKTSTSYEVNAKLGRRWLDDLIENHLGMTEYLEGNGHYCVTEAYDGKVERLEVFLSNLSIPYIHTWDGENELPAGAEYYDSDIGEISFYGDAHTVDSKAMLTALDKNDTGFFEAVRKELQDIQAIKDLIANDERNEEDELIRRLLDSFTLDEIGYEHQLAIVFMLPHLSPYLSVYKFTDDEQRLVDVVLTLKEDLTFSQLLDEHSDKYNAFVEKLDAALDVETIMALKGLNDPQASLSVRP